MTQERKIQLGTEVDPSGAKRGFDQVSQGAKDMARDVGASGAQAGAGLDKVGEGAQRSSKEVDRATRSMVSSIERATAAAKAGEKGTADYFETLARQRGANGDALRPYIDQLRQAEAAQRAATSGLGQMAVSAGQTTAALRQVPAQFTDIITSLQGGQAPLTVLLQQGGQLKDSFGGAGAAAQALGGYVLGLINPVTILAAAAGTLAYGFIAGAKEGETFRRTLIETGGVLGLSSSQLSDMSERLGTLAGGQTKAAAALNTFASTARVGSDNIERFTAAAIQLERVGGKSVEETAKAFADLKKEPLAALLKLNEGTNFLTASLVEQVKALTDAGQATEAARVAQEAFAQTIEVRSPKIIENLGYVEKALRAIKDAGAGALNAVKDIGRDSTLAQDVARETERNRRLRAATFSNQSSLKNGDGFFFSQGGLEAAQKESDALVARLRESVSLERQVAEAQGESARQAQARTKWAADGEKFLSSELKIKREIAQIESDGIAAGATRAEIETRIAEARSKLAGKAAGSSDLQQEAALLEKLSGLTGTYNRDLESLQRARQRGTVTEQQYIAAVTELIEKQPSSIALRKEEAAALEQVSKAQDRGVELYELQLKAMAKAGDQIGAQVTALRDEEEAAGIAAAKNISLARALQLVAIARVEERRSKSRDPEEISILDREIERRKELIVALEKGELRQASDKASQDAAAEWKRTADSIEQSLTDALLRGFEGGKGFAENLRDTVVNMFKTLVLRPTISGLFDGLGIKGGIGGLLGIASGAASAGTGASISGGILGAIGLGGLSMTSIGSAIGAGFMNTIGGGTILGGQGAGLLAGGASTGTGIAGIVGGALPWVGAAALLANAFGLFRSNKQVGAGITGTLGGTVEDFTVNRRGGSLFSGPSYSTPTTGTSSQNAALQETFAALREQAAQRAGVLGLDAAAARAFTTALGSEKLSDDTGGLGIRLEGLSQDEAAKKIQTELEKANERLAESLLGPLQTFRKASETANQALERLSGIQVFSNNLTQLGSVFTRVAGLSFDARQQMIDLAGGIDAFSQQALGFVQNYYSRDEIAGLKAKEIQGVLQGAGLSTDINSREQFRALVEGLDISTEAGRKQLATLLGVQGSFAGVADYLSETGVTLGQAAAGAPSSSVLQPLLASNSAQVAAVNEVRDATIEVRDAVDRLGEYFGSLPGADVGTWRRGPRDPEVGLA